MDMVKKSVLEAIIKGAKRNFFDFGKKYINHKFDDYDISTVVYRPKDFKKDGIDGRYGMVITLWYGLNEIVNIEISANDNEIEKNKKENEFIEKTFEVLNKKGGNK